jgi:Ser/Thr protein kinase RdoA (MazF antagonist)
VHDTIGHDPAHYGPIHRDLSFENVLVAGGATIVIDFDDRGDGWFAHELAVAVTPTRAAAISTPAETLLSAVTARSAVRPTNSSPSCRPS